MNTLLLCLAISTFAAAEELPAPQANISPAHAARLYRISLYETFRNERPEYQRRREIGDRLWGRFEATGYPAENKAAVIAWFTSAKEATLNNRGELPPLPEFMTASPESKVADTIVPVSTSAPREKIRVDVPPQGAITHMDITLPRQAVQTGPTRVLSSLIKQTFRTAMSEEPAAAASPPKTPTKAEPKLAPPTITLPPQADQVYPEPPKVESAQNKPVAEPFNFDELFAPTTTPVPPKPATDVDPFAP